MRVKVKSWAHHFLSPERTERLTMKFRLESLFWVCVFWVVVGKGVTRKLGSRGLWASEVLKFLRKGESVVV